MTTLVQRLGVLAVAFAASISCAEQQRNPLSHLQTGFSNESLVPTASTLQVVDKAGNAISGAVVLVGYENGNPFSGNMVTTNSAGEVAIPNDWKAALPVTVSAPGYVTTTLPFANPGDHTIVINKQEGMQEFEIAGTPTDFGRLPTDGKVDFALVIPNLTRESMLSFDISAVMSPKSDTIEILGNQLDIPSNLSLPQQRETFIFPIEFNKPNYRAYVREPGQYQVSATRGNFPLQRVVNEIRGGKSIFEVVNYFTFVEGGQVPVDVQANVGGVNFPVNQMPFNVPVQVQAPQFPSGQIMLSLALQENQGTFMPSDLKRLTSGQAMTLKSANATGPVSVLSLLLDEAAALHSTMSKMFEPLLSLGGAIQRNASADSAMPDFSKFSMALLPANAGVAPQFLPLVGKPSLNGQILTLDVPALPAGLTQVASYMVLAEIEDLSPGAKIKNERRTRLWEVWSNAWLGQVELPKIAVTKRPDRKYRWEVMFMARPANFVGAPAAGGVDLNTVTHVTRNSVEI